MGPQAETESQQFEFHAKSLKKLKVLNICISAALNTSPTNWKEPIFLLISTHFQRQER